MKKAIQIFFIINILTLFVNKSYSQEVIWATKVDTVSSQYSLDRYAAKEVLGVPNVDIQGRNSIFAWAVEPNSLNKENVETAFIEVSFSEATTAQQLAVFESFNPGAISQIYIQSMETGTNWERVYLDEDVISRTGIPFYNGQIDTSLVGKAGTVSKDFNIFAKDSVFQAQSDYRILNVFFDIQKVIAVRIVLNLLAIDGWNQIDAIGIANSTDSIKYPKPIFADQSLVVDKKPTSMGISINSFSNELAPVVSPGEERLYFSKKEYDKQNYIYSQNIWFSDIVTEKIYSCNPERQNNFKEEGIWQDSEHIYWNFNTVVPNTVVGFSQDGSKMYLSNLYEGIDTDCNCDEVFLQHTGGLSVSSLDSTLWNATTSDKITNFDSLMFKKYTNFSLNPDGNMMIVLKYDSFQSKSNVYVSMYDVDEEKWLKPYFLGGFNNSPYSFKSEISGEIVHYFVSVDSLAFNNLKVAGLNWSEPKTVKFESIENESNYTSFFITSSGKEMFLALKNKESVGDRDIYISFYNKESDNWSTPQSIGKKINTISDESSPFLDGDDYSLYFSSAGHNGFGDYDVYVSRRLDDTWLNWSEPANLGKSVNTPGSDVNFRITEKSRLAYYSSNEWSEGCADNSDIFSIQMGKAITLHIKGKTLNVNDNYNPIGEVAVNLNSLLDENQLGLQNITFESSYYTGEYDIKITKMIDANKINKFGIFAEKEKCTHTDSLGQPIDFVYLDLSNPEWEVNIYKNIFLKGPKRGGFVENDDVVTSVDPTNPDHIEPQIIIIRDTVYIPTSSTTIIGEIFIDTVGCPVIYHSGILYGIGVGGEGEPSSIQKLEPSYWDYFEYNETNVNVNEEKFKILTNQILNMLKSNDKVNVHIVASASQVPTKEYCSNFELARQRAETPEDRLVEILKANKIDLDRVYFDKRFIVEGPDYEDDAKDKKKYGKFQYVKIWLYSCDI